MLRGVNRAVWALDLAQYTALEPLFSGSAKMAVYSKPCHGFAPCDSRTQILNKLGPFWVYTPDAVQVLNQYLVSDSYGDVAHVKIARNAYNSRLGYK